MERKMMDVLRRWKDSDCKRAMVVTGERQIGKTHIIDRFGRENYPHYLRLDFSDRPQDCEIFRGSIDATDIHRLLAIRYPEFRIVKGESLLFMDEIQLCPDARSAIKPLVHDGTLDVIASGSLLSVLGVRRCSDGTAEWETDTWVNVEEGSSDEDGFSVRTTRSDDPYKRITECVRDGRTRISPMGYEEIVRMHPLDFEEYLWAVGLSREQTASIRDHVSRREPFDDVTLGSLDRYFRQYVIVGGMPAAVLRSLDPRGEEGMFSVQGDILCEYALDVSDYAPPSIRRRVRGCLDSVPGRLCRQSKRFRYSDAEGRENVGWREYADPVSWLESSGIVSICRNLTEPVQPLAVNIGSGFKMYMCDTGLLMEQLGDGSRAAVDAGDYGMNEGGVMENAVANMIERCGFGLYYLERDRRREDGTRDRIEVDFIVDMGGTVTAVEVKSGRNRRSASLNKLLDDERYRAYGIGRLMKLERSNIFTDERGVEHYPLFAAAFMDSMFEKREIKFKRGLEVNL